MSTKVVNIILGAIMALAIALSFAATRDFSKPHYEIMPDMYHAPSYDAFEQNGNTQSGGTLRSPAPGTIPRGMMPFGYEATEEDALRAGEELSNPQPSDDMESPTRGATAYAIFCQHCHGAGGAGDGMISKRGFPPPPSLLIEHAINMKDGQMFHVTTLGQGNMPAHAGQVSRQDRWNIINHIRALQAEAQRRKAKTSPENSQPPANASEGAQP